MLRNEKMGARIVLRGLAVGLRLWGLGLNSLGLGRLFFGRHQEKRGPDRATMELVLAADQLPRASDLKR